MTISLENTEWQSAWNVCQRLKELVALSAAAQDNDYMHEMWVLAMELTEWNRAMNSKAREQKNAVYEQRQQMESLMLQLQNLQYERQNLAQQIARCDAYE